MPRVPILEPKTASNDARVVYADFQRRMGFPAPPNFIKAQGHSTSVVRGTCEVVHNVLVRGEIPRYIKEMMFVAISRDRKCIYCEAAHIACCIMLGVDQAVLNQLVEDVGMMPDPETRDIILFGLKCARNPQSLTEDDFEQLRSHGLGQSEIVEIIGMSALAVYANSLADATAVEADAMFETLTNQA